jgi:hypothetical protein
LITAPESGHALDRLAALSRGAGFPAGCRREDKARCHRSALRALLAERGAKIA